MIKLLAALLVLSLIPAAFSAQEKQDKDQARIERLIRDLGSDSRKREEARRELKDIGKPAIPYLKEAARDKDAERAMAARDLLVDMMGKDAKGAESAPDVRVVYKDWAKGIEFVRDESGHLKLTVPEKDDASGKRRFKDYEADSLEEFKKRYPEIAKKYEVEKLASPESLSKDALAEWRKMKERLGIDSEGDFGNMDRWMERQQRLMERHARDWNQDDSAPGGKALGVLVAPVPSALRDQLGLKENEGLLVHAVQPDSLAKKSGLRRHDILLRLDRREIRDVETFRRDLEKELSSDNKFTLEILRGGKKETVEVAPGPSKPAK